MSTLWTPDGDVPIGGGPRPEQPTADEVAQAERELAAIRNTPSAYVIGNHAIQLFQLAQIHLTGDPPGFEDAQLAIDAMAALVEGLRGRLGEDEATLGDGLAQLRLAFVQLKAAHDAGLATPPP
jgi:hypothetical protein